MTQGAAPASAQVVPAARMEEEQHEAWPPLRSEHPEPPHVPHDSCHQARVTSRNTDVAARLMLGGRRGGSDPSKGLGNARKGRVRLFV